MDDGLLSLKWNHHQSTFFHILSQLRKSETFTDATIACEGKFFPVHRLVMSTCSDYFGDIFEKTTCKCPVVILKDIKPQEIESLLDYMYYGEVDVKQSELSGLIKAAECLRIKGLAVPDEDPTSTSSKKTSNALVNLVEPELKSPSAKRLRKDSEDSHHCNTSNKVARFQSSSVQNSVSVRSHSTSVPSQSPAADSLMQPIPITVYSETSNEKSSTSILLSQPSARVSVPVDFIKVEETMESGKKSYQATLNKESDDNSPTDRISAIENKEDDNHFQDFPNSQSGISKDDADLSSYNGTDLPQPGPSGFQGETTSEIMSWNEENSFPHIFTNEDGIPQQVSCGAVSRSISQHEDTLTSALSSLSSPPHHHLAPKNLVDALWKPHSCPLCVKSFRTTNDLKRHIRVHTGEKPYSCVYCSYTASQKQTVNRHARNVHNKLLSSRNFVTFENSTKFE